MYGVKELMDHSEVNSTSNYSEIEMAVYIRADKEQSDVISEATAPPVEQWALRSVTKKTRKTELSENVLYRKLP